MTKTLILALIGFAALGMVLLATTWKTETVRVGNQDCLLRVNRWDGRTELVAGRIPPCDRLTR